MTQKSLDKGKNVTILSEQKTKQNFSQKQKDWIFFIFTSALLMWNVIRLGNLPGLYGDTMQPDYGGIRYVFQQEHSQSFFAVVDNIQPTGSAFFYQGNISMMLMMLLMLFVGKTSVLQYHIGEAFWCVFILGAICYIFFEYLGKIVKRRISYPLVLSLSLAPAFFSTIITQYDSLLPGVFFILLHLIFLQKWVQNRIKKDLFRSCFFIGLAFSTYFCYLLFLIPAFIVVLFIGASDSGDKGFTVKRNSEYFWTTIFIGFFGTIAGMWPWFIGLLNYRIAILSQSETTKTYIWLLISGLLAIYNYFLYLISSNDARLEQMLGKRVEQIFCNVKGRIFLRLGTAMLTMLLYSIDLVAFFSVPSFRRAIFRKIESDETYSLFDKLLMSLHKLSYFTTDYRREIPILGYPVSRFPYLFRNLMLVMFFAWLVLVIAHIAKHSFKVTQCFAYSVVFLAYTALYVISTIPIVTGLNPHHYLIVYVLLFPLAGCMAINLYEMCGRRLSWIATRAGFVFMCTILVINYINVGSLIMHIKRTGGHQYYTNQLTEFAEEALEKQKNGVKAFYYLPEWGFDYSFMYLTENQIPFVQSIYDREYYKQLVDEGYTTFVVAFMNLDEDEVLSGFTEEERSKMERRIWYSLDGIPQFTTMTYHLGEDA